jgi:hypothetical protein
VDASTAEAVAAPTASPEAAVDSVGTVECDDDDAFAVTAVDTVATLPAPTGGDCDVTRNADVPSGETDDGVDSDGNTVMPLLLSAGVSGAAVSAIVLRAASAGDDGDCSRCSYTRSISRRMVIA